MLGLLSLFTAIRSLAFTTFTAANAIKFAFGARRIVFGGFKYYMRNRRWINKAARYAYKGYRAYKGKRFGRFARDVASEGASYYATKYTNRRRK